MSILDVCCGSNPVGTTNIDLYLGYSPHRSGFLDPAAIPDFHQVDVTKGLPFPDASFDVVFCKDGLEHVGSKPQKTNPAAYALLREMFRVSKRRVEIYVPHRLSLSNCERRFWRRQHNSFFNLAWFERSIPKIEAELDLSISALYELRYKPLIGYFFMMPDEIHMEAVVNR